MSSVDRPSNPVALKEGAIAPAEIQKHFKDRRNTFACCFLQGDWPQQRPELGVEYVRTLQKMIHRHAPMVQFICFTDREIPGVVTRYLPPKLPGWWSKLYAFAPSCFPLGSRVLVLDLDTVIVNNLDQILDVPTDPPVFIRDAWFNQHAGSGLFTFKVSPGTAAIWNDFPLGTKGPPFCRKDQPKPQGEKLTDEHWLHHYLYQHGWKSWDELLPGRVLSFKHHLQQNTEDPLPEQTLIVYFDGEPRPHDVIAAWNPFQYIDPRRQ
jgi:hypothetical protein